MEVVEGLIDPGGIYAAGSSLASLTLLPRESLASETALGGAKQLCTHKTVAFRCGTFRVEREFSLAVFECECSRAWLLARILLRASPSTRECEASCSRLAFKFRVSFTVCGCVLWF